MALVDRHINDFLQEIKRLDPKLRQMVNMSEGLIHVQMGDFRKYISDSIEESRFEDYEKAMLILDRYFNEELSRDSRLGDFTNAVYVSFIEHLFFSGENGAEAWSLTPAYFQRAYTHFLKQWEATQPIRPEHPTRKERFQNRAKKQSRDVGKRRT